MRTDVLVCGGGPAGLAAAIACRLRGFDVLVADCAAPPVDKACGEGLLPDAVSALAQLGIDLNTIPGAPFHGIRFIDNGASAEALFPSAPARGVPRTHLHAALHARSEVLGVQHLWRTTVTGLSATSSAVSVQTTASPVAARWCIGADGWNSRIRRWVGLDGKEPKRRIGLRTHLRIAPWSEFMEVHWGRTGQAYVTPIGPEEISLAVVARHRYASIDTALQEFPSLASRLASASRTTPERGSATMNRRLPRVTAGPVALLGDASGSVDAITGAGLGLAFRQALALAPALAAENLRTYETAHRAIVRRPALTARGLLLVAQHPTLRRATLAAFRRAPIFFELLLAFHSNQTASARLPDTALDPTARALELIQ